MPVHRLLVVSLLVSAGVATAQTSSAGSSTVLVAPPTSQDCPVALFAQRQANSVVTFAADGSPRPTTAIYRIDLEARDTPAIAAATVTAHGLFAGTRSVPAASSSPEAEASEVFHLEPSSGSPSLQHSKLRLRKLMGVSWLEITRLDYIDGSVWHASSGARCVAEPNGLLLVR